MKYTAPEMTIVKYDNEEVIVASAANTTTEDVVDSDEI